jgi:hypothetical protein
MPVTWAVQRSQWWNQYFSKNSQQLLAIPWEIGSELTPSEKRAITNSIQKFQLGEGSDGWHLIVASQRYAERYNDLDYADAIQLFIAEEQRHSRDLGRFMDINAIPRITSTYSDWVFRRVRRIASSIEIMIMTLLVAETIALVYYKALAVATKSKVLDRLCEQILKDEYYHIRFQTERLAIIRRGRWNILNLAATLFHVPLYYGAILVVWLDHAPVFQAAGISFFRYLWNCHAEFMNVLDAIRSVQQWHRTKATDTVIE